MSLEIVRGLSRGQSELARAHQPLVRAIAEQLRRALATDFEDLVSMGHDGLVQAAMAFDPTLGTAFSTFAYPWVRGAMLDGARRERRSAEIVDTVGTYLGVATSHFDATVDDEDAAQALRDEFAGNVAGSVFAEWLGAATRTAAAGQEEQAERATRERAAAAMGAAFATLAERDALLLRGHVYEKRSLKEMAETIGVSYATVRRRYDSAVQRLAVALREALAEGAGESVHGVPAA